MHRCYAKFAPSTDLALCCFIFILFCLPVAIIWGWFVQLPDATSCRERQESAGSRSLALFGAPSRRSRSGFISLQKEELRARREETLLLARSRGVSTFNYHFMFPPE